MRIVIASLQNLLFVNRHRVSPKPPFCEAFILRNHHPEFPSRPTPSLEPYRCHAPHPKIPQELPRKTRIARLFGKVFILWERRPVFASVPLQTDTSIGGLKGQRETLQSPCEPWVLWRGIRRTNNYPPTPPLADVDSKHHDVRWVRDLPPAPPAIRAGSNRHFQVLDFHWCSPKSGDVWYKSRKIKKTI